MRIRSLLATTAATATALSFGVPAVAQGGGGAVDHGGGAERTYEITITNRTFGQPLSPVAAVTHRQPVDLFTRGEAASEGIRAIAEDGDASVVAAALGDEALVTDVHVGAPIAPLGVRADAPITDTSYTFEITARPGDRISLASMLICTNDGFTGLDAVRLPNKGARLFHGLAYDAGTELNTEASTDLVDPCSALGPVVLDGDPDGNVNDAVDEDGVVTRHANVDGTIGDLLPAHAWDRAPISVRVERVG